MFGLHLVKEGLIEREYAKILTAESEDREIGDYDVTTLIEESRARRRVDDAERFLHRVAEHIGN